MLWLFICVFLFLVIVAYYSKSLKGKSKHDAFERYQHIVEKYKSIDQPAQDRVKACIKEMAMQEDSLLALWNVVDAFAAGEYEELKARLEKLFAQKAKTNAKTPFASRKKAAATNASGKKSTGKSKPKAVTKKAGRKRR